MEQNGATAVAQSPPQEGPYSVRKPQGMHYANSSHKMTTPGGFFIDRMRHVVHNTTAAGYEKPPSSSGKWSSGQGSIWGDTPDTAEMECILEIERAALRQRLENASSGLGAAATATLATAGEQAAPEVAPASAGPRQLTFSPSVVEGIPRPGSGRLRSAQRRQLSHLGRTSLASSAAAAAVSGGAGAEIEALPTILHPHLDEDAVVDEVQLGTVRSREVLQHSADDEEGIAKRQKIEISKEDQQVISTLCDFSDSSDDEEDKEDAAGDLVLKDPSAVATPAATTTAAQHAAAASPPPLDLRAYLSPDVAEAIIRIGGPKTLYQWQAECLCRPGVLQGRNLVYCAPTSGGKSLVADIVFLRRLVETRRPGLLVLPFISLCNEKKSYWDNVLQSLDREAREYYGPTSTSAPISPRTGIIVATLEKANHLITQLLEENALGMLSCVIIDELHMVGDENRGYQLELMLTKLRFAGAAAFEEEEEEIATGTETAEVERSSREDRWLPMMGLEEGTQIIGMSATLHNVNIVAKWLGAELFTTEFRPVPLCQFLKVGNLIKDKTGAVVRAIPDLYNSRLPPKELKSKDPDHVAFLAQETVDEGFSVLVFCSTRGASEATATVLSQLLAIPERHIPIKKDIFTSMASKYGLKEANRVTLAAELAQLSSSHGQKLSALVAAGVGYHHAGMEPDDKELIELAFKCGAISVLCATSSLAAGVNLPARRVIFRHPYIGRPTNVLDAANYRQMRGRAGRAGIDTHGESFLIVLQQNSPTEKMLSGLMHADPAPVESCLTLDKCGMKRAMLEVVASGAVISPTDVDRYIKCTLLAATSEYEVVMNATREALKWLGDKQHGQLIYWDKHTETFQPTAFGKAALGSGLPPELCISIRADIARARQSFVLTTELHLSYICVPATEDKSINYQWQRFELLLRNLSPSERIVAEVVGINMNYVFQKARSFPGFIGADTKKNIISITSSSTLATQQRENWAATMSEQDRICQRFGTALLLSDILQEMSAADIQAKYGLDRAMVLGLRERACRYAGMLAVFCERLGWHDVELLVSKFQARVLYGVRPEVLCLMEIDHVQAATARMLYKAGLRTPEAVAAVPDVQRVVAALSVDRGELKNEAEKMTVTQQARRIIRNAKKLLESRAKKMKEDAAEALQLVENLNQGVVEMHLDREGGVAGGVEGGRDRALVNIRDPAGRDYNAAAQYQHQQMYGGGGRVHPPQSQPQAPRAPLPTNNTLPSASNTSSGSLPTTARSLTPDLWEFGRTSGLTVLSTLAHVQALKKVLLHGDDDGTVKYARFAFQFDILHSSIHTPMQQQHSGSSTSATSWSAMPGIPSAAVHAIKTTAVTTGARGGAAAFGQIQQNQKLNYGGVAVSWRENQAFYIPLTAENPQLPLDALVSELAELFNTAKLEKVTFNLKGQLTALQRASIDLSLPIVSTLAHSIAAPVVDLRIAAFLLHPEDDRLSDGCLPGNNVHGAGSTSTGSYQQYGTKKASQVYTAESLSIAIIGPVAVATVTSSLAPAPPALQQQQQQLLLLNSRSNALQLGGGSISAARSSNSNSISINTAGRNVILLNASFPCLCRELQLKGLYDLFLNIEMPLVSILSSMEVAGVGVDTEVFKKEIPVLRYRLTELENLTEQCLSAAATARTTMAGGPDGVITTIRMNPLKAINLNSNEECAEALYMTLELAPPPSAQRLANGTWSTRAENLDELAAAYPQCPLPGIISEYRTITKLLANCIELLNYCCSSSSRGGGSSSSGGGGGLLLLDGKEEQNRIYATVNHTVAVTGRLSMDSPNLQTVPRPFAFSVPLEARNGAGAAAGGATASADGGGGGGGGAVCREERTTYVCSLRRGVVAPQGMVLLSADYKQLELRLMAHLSGDPLLLAMLRDTRIDPFIQLAARWLGAPSIASVTPEDRARAKTLAYALLYGMGASRTALELGLRGQGAEREAENLKKSFLDAFPVLQQWINHVKASVGTTSGKDNTNNNGEIRTLFGRLRRFGSLPCPAGTTSGVHGSNSTGNLGNKALNSVTQGSAADVTKLGMLAVAHAIEKLDNKFGACSGSGGQGGTTPTNSGIARLVLSIHDEFLLEVDARYVDKVAVELRAAMEGVVPWLSVPLPVKISIGKSSWGDLEEFL